MSNGFETDYFRYQRYFANVGALYQKRQLRTYTALILSLLTVAFFAFFAIRPTMVTIASLTKEIEDKQMVAQKLEEKINALTIARNEYEILYSELPLVEDALPLESDLSFFLRQMETLAVQNNVDLRSIQFGEISLRGESVSKPDSTETKEGGLSSVPFGLSVSGSYQNLKNFLQSLEDLRRIVIVSSFVFKTEKEKEGKSLILSVNGEAYYLSQNKNL